jgi:hypothetical protein
MIIGPNQYPKETVKWKPIIRQRLETFAFKISDILELDIINKNHLLYFFHRCNESIVYKYTHVPLPLALVVFIFYSPGPKYTLRRPGKLSLGVRRPMFEFRMLITVKNISKITVFTESRQVEQKFNCKLTKIHFPTKALLDFLRRKFLLIVFCLYFDLRMPHFTHFWPSSAPFSSKALGALPSLLNGWPCFQCTVYTRV